jgi:PIN domain nuclease of toxin-antitoxin system
LLIDTHAVLWWWRSPEKLSPAAKVAIASAADVWVSAVSALEIATKWRAGKLDMIGDPARSYFPLMAANHFNSLALTDAHALAAGMLAFPHKDPFDRLIAAQALAENMTVVTCDAMIAGFGCKTLW